MKITMKSAMLIALGGLLAGCAGMRSDLVLDTAGPMPGQAAPAASGPGFLLVYSAGKVNADFNSHDPNRREYSDYKILNSDNELVRRVHNMTEDILQGPVLVELPPGKYFVIARSNGYGIVTVPVIITSAQQTVLHLDGQWPNQSSISQDDAVRLPDGEIVGWKSASGS
jgi:hypothetical protein